MLSTRWRKMTVACRFRRIKDRFCVRWSFLFWSVVKIFIAKGHDLLYDKIVQCYILYAKCGICVALVIWITKLNIIK